jgi:hypothetical protein
MSTGGPPDPGLPFLAETDETPYTDCMQASEVMCANYADPSIPVTIAERERLDAADGNGLDKPTDWPALDKGAVALWGRQGRASKDEADLVAELSGGAVAVVMVRYTARTDHAISVGPMEGSLVWRRDPLKKAGEWVDWSTVRAAWLGGSNARIFHKREWVMLEFTPTSILGTVTVLGTGHCLVPLDGSTWVTIADKTQATVFAEITLAESVKGGQPAEDRTHGWLTYASNRACVLLKKDTGPLPPKVGHLVTFTVAAVDDMGKILIAPTALKATV